MSYPDNPHIKLPFQLAGRAVAVVEQDSPDEIAQNVEVILRYPLGSRPELPDFGVRDLTFSEGQPDLNEIQTAITLWEPRADALIESEPDFLDDLVAHVHVELRGT
jgi:phage baseplate assembly protein W